MINIVELEKGEIPNKKVELAFIEKTSMLLIVRFNKREFEDFLKVVDSLSLKEVDWGYETPFVGSDEIARWNKGKLETEKVEIECGVGVDIQINGAIIILELIDGKSRVTQDFSFKQWAKFKQRLHGFTWYKPLQSPQTFDCGKVGKES